MNNQVAQQVAGNLVNAQWLSERTDDENVKVVDGSWHLPTTGRDARAEFGAGHIPGAIYFDIDQCVTPSPLPHMLPAKDRFADYAGSLGISEENHIVVYDSLGVFSAARVWWMFRRYGALQVSVLNGGLPAWIDAGNPLESGNPPIAVATFNARMDGELSTHGVVDAPQVLKATSTDKTIILDARSPGRFTGAEKEFRAGLRSGHIPDSLNVPFTELLDNGYLKPDHALETIFRQCGALDNQQVITTCGSGVTAAVLCLALERVGVQNIALYDGSWSEWGGLADMPVNSVS